MLDQEVKSYSNLALLKAMTNLMVDKSNLMLMLGWFCSISYYWHSDFKEVASVLIEIVNIDEEKNSLTPQELELYSYLY